jgi:hypothetical protein
MALRGWLGRCRRETPASDSLESQAIDERSSSAIEARSSLRQLAHHLHTHLSARGAHMFHELFIEHRSVDEVARLAGLSRAAVYAWHSRIQREVGLFHMSKRAQ